MKLIIASNNEHKLIEIRQILGGYFGEILSMREAGIEHETVEDGSTFMENALKKAREVAELSGCCALADDSGLCVDALDGAPGIYSARFAGVHGDDEANRLHLLELMQDKTDRGAHFTCAMALVWPDGRTVTAEGYIYGEITREKRGSNGFGYDPLFLVPELGLTTAELEPEQKNAISHRAAALHALVEKLEAREEAPETK
jgi:XTP/dITP diphosphohydrolase